ncbi:MAG: AAA family ATPase [Candidatus Bathyarchaeia archaeon]
MSVSALVEDNWWWKPDFLSFLQGLLKIVNGKSPEEVESLLRVPLTEEMAERDPELSQQRRSGASLRVEEIWLPRLLFLLRKNILFDAAEGYVLVSIRGPRRVGKTTLVKLLLRELLLYSLSHPNEAHPLKVVYVRCDRAGLGGVEGLVNLIRDFLARRRDYPGSVYVFLDEVSSLRNWQVAVKDLFDAGVLTKNRVKLLITGSHSLDVKKESEVLGLRKGVMLEGGNDKLLFPMKFAEYAYYKEQLAKRRILRDFFTNERFLEVQRRLEAFMELTKPSGKMPAALEMAEAYLDELYAYFEDYLLTGGFPLAVRQQLALGRIDPSVYSEFVDLAVKDAMKWRLNEDTLYNVLWELLEAPGGLYEAVPIKETSANSLALKLGISHNTVKQYLDYLVDAFVLLEIAKLKEFGRRRSPVKTPRKFYFWDPLMFYAFKAISAGIRDAYTMVLDMSDRWKGVMTEMVVASNVAHMVFSLEVIQDLRLLKRKLFYYKPQPSREIDFLVDIKGRLVPIEVYSGGEVDGDHVKKLVRISEQLGTRGILVYRGKETRLSEDFVAIPAPLFMLLS